ncbi:MAG: ABC transporter permease [archaeon]|nr:MAG: ABC transporter permease [archaeon]
MGLARYVARRTVYTIVLLLIIVAFNFVLFQILPFVTSCPNSTYNQCAISLYAPEQPPRGVQNVTLWLTQIRGKIFHQYGFDQPMLPGYGKNPASSKCETMQVIAPGGHLNATKLSKGTRTINTSLSASSIPLGGTVYDTAVLSQAALKAGGTVSYYYSGSSYCPALGATPVTVVNITNGVVPHSTAIHFEASNSSGGTYYFYAVYSGESNMTFVPGRFLTYYQNMFTFNFGYNLGNVLGGTVLQTIQDRTPYTILLIGSSTIAAFIMGIGLGVIAAAKRGKIMDVSSLSALLFVNALPVFFLGGMLELSQLALTKSFYQPLGSALIGVDGWNVYVVLLQELFLPALTLTLANIGGVFLTQRAVMIDTISEDYIIMARAKGLPERTVLYRHALRNAVLPIATAFALSIGFILSGAIITETVFGWPGLGYAIYQGVSAIDFPLEQAMFFIISVMVLIAVFAAEVIYGFLDPRVSTG